MVVLFIQGVGKQTLKELGLGGKGRLFSVGLNDPLRLAFQKIKENDISAVPVIDNEGIPIPTRFGLLPTVYQ